jgi:hypothetical protein
VDEIRSVFWETFRHLFPPHAKVVQTESGAITISWTMAGDPYAQSTHAAPITIRFEEDLLLAMRTSGAEQRKKIAARQEPVLRAGMIVYDPYAAVPKARVIVLG